MHITPHFTTAEFERSQTAARAGISIHVQPGTDIWRNVAALCEHILEPLRAAIGETPILISSGYRPDPVNDLVGGAPNSQHTTGEAADISAIGMTDYDLAHLVYASELPFDQCIYEFGRWVHVSYTRHRKPRREALTSYCDGEGNVFYAPGIVAIASLDGARR